MDYEPSFSRNGAVTFHLLYPFSPHHRVTASHDAVCIPEQDKQCDKQDIQGSHGCCPSLTSAAAVATSRDRDGSLPWWLYLVGLTRLPPRRPLASKVRSSDFSAIKVLPWRDVLSDIERPVIPWLSVDQCWPMRRQVPTPFEAESLEYVMRSFQ